MTIIDLSPEIRDRARKVKLLLMDCDGVLTDGRLYFSERGEELKVFHVRDGQGIVEWHEAGFRSGIISGRDSPIVEMRSKQLGIEYVFQGRKEKLAPFQKILHTSGVTPDEVAFIGDDRPDAALMALVGLSAAPGDAHQSSKDAAHLNLEHNGGCGAVREFIDLMLELKKIN